MSCRLFSITCGALLLYASSPAQSDCGWNPDYDGDNQIGVADLLGLLGVFEEQDSDDDGIWDSQDDCIGVVDSCGICNGPGADVPIVESIVVFYDSTYIEALDNWVVYEVGVDTTFSFVCATPGCTDPEAANYSPDAHVNDDSCLYGPPECGGSSVITFDGYSYDLISAASRCWFAENLRTTKYANGDSIHGVITPSEWTSSNFGAQAIYNHEAANLQVYGRLYNWYAVADPRGICPSGWNVPSDDEWTELIEFFGGSSDAGNHLKSSPLDVPSWNGINSSGFSALPGGSLYDNGDFNDVGHYAFWWSATENGENAWNRFLVSVNHFAYRDQAPKGYGHSVRCIRCLDFDGDGVCNEDEVPGCISSDAYNYDSSATEDDGSCLFGPAACAGESDLLYNGRIYGLVAIGDQCWFQENLATEQFANGDAILSGLTGSEWEVATEGASSVYGDDDVNESTWGRLYNWYAVSDFRGLCPIGWHVPSDEEWTLLTDQLGGADVAGNLMKSSPSDSFSWDGTNSSGFSALPGGLRGSSGNFVSGGGTGYWWSSSADGILAWFRNINTGYNFVNRYNSPHYMGCSVRCLLD